VLRELFTVKKVVVYFIVLAVLAFVSLRVMHPELFAEKEKVDLGEGLEK
jgi:hypothetical protein